MSETDPRAVIDAYAEGTRTRDIDMLRAAFHPDAVMSGWLGPDLLHGSPQPFFDALGANEVGPDYRSEITALEVDGPIAWAETREENLLGLSFLNRFHLLRLEDGTWRIVAKLFRHA
jgi:hypothetical protein